jgi:hypothetical protein
MVVLGERVSSEPQEPFIAAMEYILMSYTFFSVPERTGCAGAET